MAQTPAERRAKRDETARARINPDTGEHFKNYNQLDTWQRNQKAKKEGFTSRAQKRGSAKRSTPEQDKARKLPNSYHFFLRGRPSSETLAKEFNFALGPLPKAMPGDERFRARAEREFILRFNQAENWPMWRNEYDAVYG